MRALSCSIILTLLLMTSAAGAASLLVEAEDFQFTGGWVAENARREAAERYLIATPDKTNPRPVDAATAVRVAQAGRYAVWVFSKDYGSFMPRTRRYRVAIDGTALPGEGGRHGGEGWSWERLGEAELTAGEHLLALRHVNSMPRCDCVVLTTEAQSPASWTKARRTAARVTPLKITGEDAHDLTPVVAPGAARRKVANLENEWLRIGFQAARDTRGREVILKNVEIRLGDGRWVPLPRFGEDERLFLMRSKNPGLKFPATTPRNPLWRPAIQASRVTVGGKKYQVYSGATDNPFLAAQSEALVATAARQASAREVEVRYRTAGGLEATGRWSLAAGAHDLRFALTLTPQVEAYYSVGLCAFGAVRREQAKFVQLPPLYQFQRLPETPVLISSAMTPQPLALVEREIPIPPKGGTPKQGGTPELLTCAVIAEPEALEFVWPNITNAKYGFSLLNAAGQAQPCGFSPVLGYEGSRWAAGQPRTVAWRLFAAPGDWKAALERISDEVMELKDYRRPLGASLTEAALNMIDLLRDAKYGGWDTEMKSFFDIETQGMGKQAAPLVLLSVAMLTRDERFWRERALPTLEFTLSRRRFDFIDPARADPAREGTPERLIDQLAVPTQGYGTSYWQGAYELLGRLNPWLEEFILPEGKPALGRGANSPPYAEWLAAWRYRPDPAFLREAMREADEFLKTQVYGPQTRPVGWVPFYNISFYPNWWNLLDLYEASGQARYREAAVEGAFHTIAGLWSHPRVDEEGRGARGEGRGANTDNDNDKGVVVYPGGSVARNSHIWSRDGKPYRLGWPREAGDTPEHRAPAWTVAQTGLGLEQPSTYTALTTETGMRNIMNATWAPHLLRAYEATGREIFRTYARNAIVGRFANYPGYYLNQFIDSIYDPAYPMKGPDLTSFYYHHIPVHLGFTLDWLVTEADVRSGGKVRFPYVIQKDYAWFNNRVYGAMAGEVFGDKAAALWLERGIAPCKAVEVDWLAARGPERVHLMLMNQLHEPVRAALTLDPARLGLRTGEKGVMRIGSEGKEEPFDLKTAAVTIPALGLVTLSLPAERRETFPAQAPLKKGHVKTAAGGAWGELHAFRIRCPLGGDALYVVLTGEPPQGAVATLSLEGAGKGTIERRRYPYEFSVDSLPAGGEVKIEVGLEAPGAAAQSFSFTL